MSTTIKNNPLNGGGAAQEPATGTFSEKLYRAPFPLCCVTKGGTVTTVGEKDLLIRKDITYCRLSIKNGAGYDLDHVALPAVSSFGMWTRRFCNLGAGASDMSVIVKPTGHALPGDLGPGPVAEEWLAAMKARTSAARGKGDNVVHKEFVFATKCGLDTKTLLIHTNGLVVTNTVIKGMNSQQVQHGAHLDDLGYVRYTQGGLIQKLCFGINNRIELSFMHDVYVLDMVISATELQLIHDAILFAWLGGRQPSPHMNAREGIHTGGVFLGAKPNNALTIGPEFTTVQVQKGDGVLLVKEVTTFKTGDVSHLRASLPSWHNALLRAIRDIELVKISNALSNMSGPSLVLLPVWPCAFFNDMWLTIVLSIKALVSITQFLIIFFCRKTALIVGGPGPAKTVAFEPNGEPELFLRDVAAVVEDAQCANTAAFGVGIKRAYKPSLAMTSGASKEDPKPISPRATAPTTVIIRDPVKGAGTAAPIAVVVDDGNIDEYIADLPTAVYKVLLKRGAIDNDGHFLKAVDLTEEDEEKLSPKVIRELKAKKIVADYFAQLPPVVQALLIKYGAADKNGKFTGTAITLSEDDEDAVAPKIARELTKRGILA